MNDEQVKIAKLIALFTINWDPYEYKDMYDYYNDGVEDFYNELSSKQGSYNLLYNLYHIRKDLCNDLEDKEIDKLYKQCDETIYYLRKYINHNFDNEKEL